MGSRLRRAAIPAVFLLAVACGGVARSETAPPPTTAPRQSVAALGRVQPKDGVLRVAGPSFYFAVVVDKLEVEEGDPCGEAVIAVWTTIA